MSVTLTANESLTFTPANRFKDIQELANLTMSRTAVALIILALNDDPQIILLTLAGKQSDRARSAC